MILKIFSTILFFLIFSTLSADVYVYKIANNKVSKILPVQQSGYKLPDSLTMNPGYYKFHGKIYDCTGAGLYRFINVPHDWFQKVVIDHNILCSMQALSWLHAHGTSDDKLTATQSMEKASKYTLRQTCGSISNFYVFFLSKIGIPSRFVLLLTLDEWNSYDNGHSLVEIYHDGKWNLWDLTFKNYFESGGIQLSALEFKDAVLRDNFSIHHYSNSPLYTIGDFASNGCEFYLTGIFNNSMLQKKWYKKIAHVLLIRVGSQFYFTCELEHRKRVESYDPNFLYLDYENFIRNFYP